MEEESQMAEAEETANTRASLFQTINESKPIYLNTLILSFAWFVIGFNFYGLLHSWCKISGFNKKFEHDVLSAVLGFISQILAIFVCLAVRQVILKIPIIEPWFARNQIRCLDSRNLFSLQKSLPLTILQILGSATYFYQASVSGEAHDDAETLSGTNALIYVMHITSFLETAALDLIWLLTIELFPKGTR